MAHWESASPMDRVPSGVLPTKLLRRHVVPLRVNVTIASPPHASAAVSATPGLSRDARIWYNANAPNTSGFPDARSPLASAGGSTSVKTRCSSSVDGVRNAASAVGGLAKSASTPAAFSFAITASSMVWPRS